VPWCRRRLPLQPGRRRPRRRCARPCRHRLRRPIDRAGGALAITAPPVGLVAVGGYRFLSHDLEQWAARLSAGAMLTALPDQLNGFRLAGRASDNRRAREAFGELGSTLDGRGISRSRRRNLIFAIELTLH